MRLQYIGMSGKAKSVNAADIRLMNAYSEVTEHKQGKSILTVYRTPGLRLWYTLPGTGPVRGLCNAASVNRSFAVQGNTFYELYGTLYSPYPRGTLQSNTGPVQMDENGVVVSIVDGAGRYSLNFSTNVFTTDTSVSFPVADRVGFIDGRFIYVRAGTSDAFYSDPYSTTVQPLNSFRAEGRPDPLVSLLVPQREAWLFGVETTQPFYSTGNPDTPFAAVGSVFIPHGTAAAQSPAMVGQTVCWLSRNREGHGMVVQASGQAAQPVSTHAVAEAIQRYSTIEDAIGWAQQHEQHLFYWLTFPQAKATWCLDLTTSLWHERGWRNPATGFLERHRANCYTFAFGKHLVGDYE